MLHVEIDTAELRQRWARAMSVLESGLPRAVNTAVRGGAQHAINVHPYRDRSGDLTSSIRGELVMATKGEAVGEIRATAKYASFVENGTRPHVIEARRARFLRWESADGVHFAVSVNHPGGRPYPFLGPALLRSETLLERELDLLAARAAGAVNG